MTLRFLLAALLILSPGAAQAQSGGAIISGVQGPSSATNAHVAVFSGTSGQIIADGGAPVGTGTVTSVTCGTGLTGGTITGSGTCAADFGTASSKVAQGGVITGAGPTGSATVTPIITYNAAGQLTTVTSATVTPAVGSVTGLGTGVATLLGGTASGTGGPAGTAGPTLTGTVTETGLLDISGASAGQIKFPATQNQSADPNTLDDYEEGTWTPTITFGGVSTGNTYTTQSGTYTKIGNRVLLNGTVVLSTKGSATGQAAVGGLPFTVGTVSAASSILGTGLSAATTTALQALAITGSNSVTLYTFSAGVQGNTDQTNFAAGSTIVVSVQYQTTQ